MTENDTEDLPPEPGTVANTEHGIPGPAVEPNAKADAAIFRSEINDPEEEEDDDDE